jgi:hypothetical protein
MERSQEYEPIILDLQKSQVVKRPRRYLVVSLLAVVVVGVLTISFVGVNYWRSLNNRGDGQDPVTLITPVTTPDADVSPTPSATAVDTPSETPPQATPPPEVTKEAKGFLNLYSSPDSAEVSIDGKSIGRTPLMNYELAPGTYTINFTHQGTVSEHKITIKAGETTEYEYTFKGFGALNIRTIPRRSDIYLNSKHAGKSPLPIEGLLPGTYTVTARQSGYVTTEKTVVVKEDHESQDVLIILQRQGTGRSLDEQPTPTPGRPVHPSERLEQ